MIDAPPPQPPAIEQLAPCGLKVGELRANYDDTLRSWIVTIPTRAGASTSGFPCIRRTAWAKFDISFEDKELGALYSEYERAVQEVEGRALARAWLKRHGKLANLPQLKPEAQSLPEFLRAMESFCGYSPDSRLAMLDAKTITMRWSERDFTSTPQEIRRFECLTNAMSVTNLDEHGLSFGFVGNEQHREPGRN